jgi:hypothetical protein
MPHVPTPITKRAASHSRRKQAASAIIARPSGAPDATCRFINDRSNRLAGIIGLPYDVTRSALGLFAAFKMRPTSPSSALARLV